MGLPMGTNCAPLIADLFLFCYVKKLELIELHQNNGTNPNPNPKPWTLNPNPKP